MMGIGTASVGEAAADAAPDGAGLGIDARDPVAVGIGAEDDPWLLEP